MNQPWIYRKFILITLDKVNLFLPLPLLYDLLIINVSISPSKKDFMFQIITTLISLMIVINNTEAFYTFGMYILK